VQAFVKQALLCVAFSLGAFVITSCDAQTDPTGIAQPTADTVKILHRSLGSEPETLVPALADDNAALTVLSDLFEGLTTETAEGRIIPGAAERWMVSADGTRWTFSLRPGLRWSDGKPLNAVHFESALAALLDRASASPYSSLLEGVVGVRAVDGNTLEITTARPLPQLPAILALPFAAPLHDGPQGKFPLVGNGPYRLVSRTPGVALQLERNPYYREVAAVPIERVRYLTLDDLSTELKLYRAGELDVTSEVPNASIPWIQQNLPGELQVAPYLSTYGYAFNLNRVRDTDARMALVLAVDRQQLTTMVTGAGEIPAFSWVPPGIPGYQPARFDWADQPPAQREALAAQRWAAAAKRHAAPATLTLCTDASANHRRTAVALVDHWRRVLGVEVQIVEVEWKAYLSLRDQPGECDLLRFGWSADYVDPEAFLTLFTAAHPQNVSHYANAGYDALLRAAQPQTDHARRSATLAQAEQLLLADGVVIPVFHRVTKRLVKPNIEGVAANPLGHLQSRYLRFNDSHDEKK
jgi:oligopeptide transport system substrate-binding protein